MATQLAKVITGIVMLLGSYAIAMDSSTPIQPFTAEYILENKYVTGGEATFALTRQNDRFRLVLETRPTGVFRFSDKGKIKEAAELSTLSPPYLANTYTYTNLGDMERSYESTYNRDSGAATVVRNGKTNHVPMAASDIDRLSTTLTIMQKLREDPEMSEFSVDMISERGTQTVEFISKGLETINTRLGKVDATRIDRKRSNSNRSTVTWFAAMGPNSLPVPVQIEQYKRGKLTIRLRIRSFSTTE